MNPQPVVVLVRAQLRADADVAAYEVLGARMDSLVRAMPGFVDATDYATAEGGSLSVVTFASMDALLAWRHLPEHVAAQQLGRERFYARYDIRVCTVARAYDFSTEGGRTERPIP